MNFLSHFYHEIPVSDPYFTVGIILPDILSNYSFRAHETVKLHVAKIADSDDEEILALSRGARRHYEVDGFFHNSEFFDRNVEAIKQMILPLGLQPFQKRLYAFAHVALEIILDRTILDQEPEICDQMYALLAKARPEVVTEFISINTTASNPAGVADHLAKFIEHKFLYDYLDDDRLVELLGRINSRLGNPMFTSSEKILIKPVIHDIEKTLLAQKFPKFRTDL
jgi:hypothetical protein